MLDFEEWSAYQAEFTDVVAALQYYLRWQEAQGWAGIPREDEEVSILSPYETLPDMPVPGTTINRLNLNSLTNFLQQKPSASVAPPPPETLEKEAAPDHAATLARKEAPFHALSQISAQEMHSRAETLRALSKEQNLVSREGAAQGNQPIFGAGPLNARVAFVFEWPGGRESITGDLMEDPEGRLWGEMLRAVSLSPQQVYRTFVMKVRPSSPSSVPRQALEAHLPFLWRELQCVQPSLIVPMGLTATQSVLNTEERFLSKLRERWHEHEGMTILPSFHPLYLLRNPEEKARAWEDMTRILKKLRSLQGD